MDDNKNLPDDQNLDGSGPEPTMQDIMTKVDEVLASKKEDEVNLKELILKQNDAITKLQEENAELKKVNLELATQTSAPQSTMSVEEIMMKSFAKE